MFRSVLPPFVCVSLLLHLALVIQIRVWKGQGILGIVDPCHLLVLAAALPLPAWRLSGEAKVSLERISQSFFAQIFMAPSSSTAHLSCSSDHSPTVFTLSRRSTQVPVDQESGPRVWNLQLTCQGAFIPGGIL